MKGNLEKLAEIIAEKGEEICESSRIARFIRPYMEISEEYAKHGVTPYFTDVYATYYRMNGPTGSSPEFKKAYFSYMERLKAGEKVSYEEISEGLYEVEKRHQFSLITKLLHTVDGDVPIYDAQIGQLLGMGGIGGGSFEEKEKRGKEILSELPEIYDSLGEDEKFMSAVKVLDEVYYKNRFPFYAKCHFILSIYIDDTKKESKATETSEKAFEKEPEEDLSD